MPAERTWQQHHEKIRKEANAFGHHQPRFDRLCALFEQKKKYAADHGRALVMGGHNDDTDLGQKQATCRMVQGRRVIDGTICYGGNEEIYGVWVIEGVIRSKAEVLLFWLHCFHPFFA